MEYLDELDDSALQAFAELDGGDLNVTSGATTVTKAASSPKAGPIRSRRVEATYLFRLEHPLSTSRDVAHALELPRVPETETGSDGDGAEAHFCRLSQTNIDALDTWIAENCPDKSRSFTKIRLGIAHKDPHQLPLLGRDPTLPHHRPAAALDMVAAEPQWPVYYFFYGTLASPSRLSRLFGVGTEQLSQLEPAVLLDGQIQTWAGKYLALVDAPGSEVEGHVSEVMSADQEEALRLYEGDSYEVVRARVIFEGREIEVRTFRFAGYEDELDGEIRASPVW